MEKKQKYILYGASFNPPHMGHFSAIRQLAEKYDKIIVFPYPHKHDSGQVEKIVPIRYRLDMLSSFITEFFPTMSNKILVVNLAKELKTEDRKTDGFFHTYDYLKYIETKIDKNTTSLEVCLGIDAQKTIEKETFYNEDKIKEEFGVFYLTEEKTITSEQVRNFLAKTKVKSKKDEQQVIKHLGVLVSKYVIKKLLYGISIPIPKKKVNNKININNSDITNKNIIKKQKIK